MKYTLMGKIGERVLYESHHRFLIAVYWNWFILNAVPAINPLAKINWSYRKNK